MPTERDYTLPPFKNRVSQAAKEASMNIFSKTKTRIQEKKRELELQSSKKYFYDYCYSQLAGRKRVLDLGCGVGRFLRSKNDNLIGIDANYGSLREAKIYSPRLICGDLRQLPFPDGSFDGINCHHVIEHFNPEGAYQLLLEADRILKEGGVMVISTPLSWEGFFDDFTHLKPYSPEAIKHYYGERKFQATKDPIVCVYKEREIKWRYGKVPLEPFLFPKNSFMNALSLVFFQWLGNRGFGRYVKTGYTMVLEKIK